MIYDKKGEEHQFDKAVELLSLKILDNMKRRMEEGVDQQHYLLALRAVQSDFYNEEQERLVEDLIIEVNAEMELIKLPSRFKDRIKTITHFYKKKIADQILNATLEHLVSGEGLYLNGEKVGMSGVRGVARKRSAIPLTPEVVERLKKMQDMSLKEIAEDTNYYELLENQVMAFNFEKKSVEMVKSESDAKLHELILNPNNKEIPDNLEMMSPQELAANGIQFFKGKDLIMGVDGQVSRITSDEKSFEKVVSVLEELYDAKNKKNPNENSGPTEKNEVQASLTRKTKK